MTTKKNCLVMMEGPEEMEPDYYPVSLKQAKQFLKLACKGHTKVGQMTGLRFRLKYLTLAERHEFNAYGNRICNKTLARWNAKK